MTAGELIKKWRKEKGFTQKQLANATGIATITIQQYEADKYKPKFERFARIAQVLDIPDSDFTDAITSQNISISNDELYSKMQLFDEKLSVKQIFKKASFETEYYINNADETSRITGVDKDTILYWVEKAEELNLLMITRDMVDSQEPNPEGILFALSTKQYSPEELDEIFDYIEFVRFKRSK